MRLARSLIALAVFVVVLLSFTAPRWEALADRPVARLPAVAVTTSAAQSRATVPTPLLAVVGASFTAGVGAKPSTAGWAQQLSHMLGWRLVISAESGAGYVSVGTRHRGPLSRLAARLGLARAPTVLLIQGGYNDIGQPLSVLKRRVGELVSTLARRLPGTPIGLVTVFTALGHRSARAAATDQAIVSAALLADPNIMIFDPLVERWEFARSRDRLHPSPAGHRRIAELVAQALRGYWRAGVGCQRVDRSCPVARLMPRLTELTSPGLPAGSRGDPEVAAPRTKPS